MSGGGSGGGTQTTVQKSDPWAGQQSYLTDIYGRAQSQANTPMQFYQGQTYADLSPETQAALSFQTNRAIAGSPLIGAAQQQLTDTMAGKYLDPTTNPAFQKSAADIQGRLAGQFSGAGRYGSGAMLNQQREALTDLAAKAYGDERANQIRGMLFAPQLAQQDYFDASKLAEVGAIREDQGQRAINEAMQRQQFEQMEPWQRLGLYGNLVQGNVGGTTEGTTTLPRRSLGAADAIGGLTSLASLGMMAYGMFGGSDRKMKTDIKKVGKTNEGLNVYTYEYKGLPGRKFMGVMHQEVAKKKPEAATEVGGLKFVNYGLLG